MRMRMSVTGLMLLLVLLLLCSVSPGISLRFLLISEPQSWMGARSYCRENYTDLVTLQTDADRLRLKEAADAAGFTSFAWVGLYNGVLRWRWSLGDQEISFSQWESWEPDLGRTQEACAHLDGSQRWGDASCLDLKSFFCQTNGTTVSDRFVFVPMTLPWREAQLYCRTHHVDLSTIDDDQQNAAMASIMTSNGSWTAWIGLSKNLWLWADGSGFSWTGLLWQEGQPDNVGGVEECGCAGTEGEIADDICASTRYFYCSAPDEPLQRRTAILRIQLKTNGLMNENVVRDAVEKQVKRMLSEQQMDTGSNITWRIQPDGKVFHQHGHQTPEKRSVCEDSQPAER